jgi:hypothetical protein
MSQFSPVVYPLIWRSLTVVCGPGPFLASDPPTHQGVADFRLVLAFGGPLCRPRVGALHACYTPLAALCMYLA